MAYAQLSSPCPPAGASAAGDLRRLAAYVLAPLRDAHRRLMLRQQLEALPDRLLQDAGIAREDLPGLLRRR
jgi:hypothetical protein